MKTTGLNVANGGLLVSADGLTVSAGGMDVTNGLSVMGDVSILAGALSITSSSSTTASVLDVLSSSASFVGNTIVGRVTAGTTTGNALRVRAGGSTIMRVSAAEQIFVLIHCAQS